jgi:hypothetical protein
MKLVPAPESRHQSLIGVVASVDAWAPAALLPARSVARVCGLIVIPPGARARGRSDGRSGASRRRSGGACDAARSPEHPAASARGGGWIDAIRDPARATLGDPEAPLQVRRCGAVACRAQKFPRVASFGISMSRSRSATICFSRRFSSRSWRSSFVLGAHPAVGASPTVEGVLGDLERLGVPRRWSHPRPSSVPELAHDLLRRVLPASHGRSSLPFGLPRNSHVRWTDSGGQVTPSRARGSQAGKECIGELRLGGTRQYLNRHRPDLLGSSGPACWVPVPCGHRHERDPSRGPGFHRIRPTQYRNIGLPSTWRIFGRYSSAS